MENKDESPAPPPVDDSALLKPKPKREQTEKQKAVWAKAQQTRLDNAKAKREAAAKALEELENKKKLKEEKKKAKLAKSNDLAKTPKVLYDSESEEEPEVIVVKKKKPKKVIYQEESSDEETPAIPAPLPREKKPVPAQIIPQYAAPPPVQIKPIVRFF
jgi:hypothetical protein